MIEIECPCCGSMIEVEHKWAFENGRIFCNTCCKSFEVEVPPPMPEDIGYKGYYGETF